MMKCLILSTVLLAIGCFPIRSRDPCQEGGEAGSAHRLPLVASYNAMTSVAKFESAYALSNVSSCDTLDGLAEGQELLVRILDAKVALTMGDVGCWVHLGEIAAPTGWKFVSEAGVAGFSRNLITIAARNAQNDGCRGIWYLKAEAPYGSPFRNPTPDTPPPVLVSRHFSTERAEDCPAFAVRGLRGAQTCADQWVSRLLR